MMIGRAAVFGRRRVAGCELVPLAIAISLAARSDDHAEFRLLKDRDTHIEVGIERVAVIAGDLAKLPGLVGQADID